MICRACCKAADNDQQDKHCSDPACTCAHHPLLKTEEEHAPDE